MIRFRFYLITDNANSRHNPLEVLPALARAGLRALQVREKNLSPAKLAVYAGGLADSLGQSREKMGLFLNDRADIALSLGYDGVHLRSESLPLERHAASLRSALMFGVSTHSLEEVRAAENAGADFATFGPVFATPSKADFGNPLGLKSLATAAKNSRIPLFALGGVTPQRTRDCLESGAFGVAAISGIWNADNPLKALREYQQVLQKL